jgi:hypothetical protein
MSDDPTNTDNGHPALVLIVTPDAQPIDGKNDPTNTENTSPALRMSVPPVSATS